jgi:hypothetical protein
MDTTYSTTEMACVASYNLRPKYKRYIVVMLLKISTKDMKQNHKYLKAKIRDSKYNRNAFNHDLEELRLMKGFPIGRYGTQEIVSKIGKKRVSM